MSMHDFVCRTCKVITRDVIHPLFSVPVLLCPKCGKEMKKAMHAPYIKFRGEGWWSTSFGNQWYNELDTDADKDDDGYDDSDLSSDLG